MPVRDAAPYVEEALASILDQTVSELEVVVVDDGSRDGTSEILDRCAARDRRVHLVKQERAGVVVASARAYGLARGPVLARMDADDIALPDRLECQLDRLAVGDVGACGGQVEFFPDSEVRDGMRRYEQWLNELTSPALAARDVFVECPIAHPTLTLRREALAAAGGWRAGARAPGRRTTTSCCGSIAPVSASAVSSGPFYVGASTPGGSPGRMSATPTLPLCAARCITYGLS